jgi:hypothetical protein
MAEQKAQASKQEAKEKAYFIVNPSGTIHEVTREHATGRLRQVGYRLASKEEIAAYKEANGNQRAGRPLAKPWSPEPEPEPELE